MSTPVVSISRETVPGSAGSVRALGALLRWGLILLLALAPLPMAAVYPWAWSLLALASGAVLLTAAARAIAARDPDLGLSQLRLPMALGLVVVLWIGFQQVPDAIHDWYSALWSEAAQGLGAPIRRSISLDRERSLGHLLRLLCYAGVFLSAWSAARSTAGATGLLRAIGFIGVAYAAYGLVVYFAGNRYLLWYPKWAYQYDLTGTFVNRNSFATFLGLCLTAELGLLAQTLLLRVDGRSPWTLMQSSIEAMFYYGAPLILGLVAIVWALLLTHSRGGVFATVAGSAALVAAVMAAPSLREPGRWPIAALAGCGALAMLVLAGSGLLGRVVDSASELGGRTLIYAGTLDAIADHPVLGTGLGSFERVFPPYQPQSETHLIEFAHNDYLQNMLELGIPAAAVFYAMLALLVGSTARGVFRRRRNAIFPCVGLGASVLAMAHSSVDFSMQMPAVSVTYAALLGMAVAQSEGSRKADHPASGMGTE